MSQNYTGMNIEHLLPSVLLLVLHTHNNTNGKEVSVPLFTVSHEDVYSHLPYSWKSVLVQSKPSTSAVSL